MTRTVRLMTIAAVVSGVAACSDSVAPAPHESLDLDISFNAGAQGWVADFTDYEAALKENYEFQSGIQKLPAPLDTLKQAYMLSTFNQSDDVFQYIRRQVTGLVPNADYDIRFRAELATNAPTGCSGVGGAPGESVWLKAGASRTEPVPVDSAGDVRLSVDKGEQAQDGEAALVLGNLANTSEECHDTPYELKSFDSQPDMLRARTDAHGRLWLFVGTESGFEAVTRVYITSFRATMERVE